VLKKESIKNKELYHLNKAEKQKRKEEYCKDNSLSLVAEYQSALDSHSRSFANNPSSAYDKLQINLYKSLVAEAMTKVTRASSLKAHIDYDKNDKGESNESKSNESESNNSRSNDSESNDSESNDDLFKNIFIIN